MSSGFLPYTRQSIGEDDIKAVAEALRSDFLTTGPLVEAFERDFSLATGAAHTVACNSGTAALHLAMLVQNLSQQDAVIVPSVTFLATANVVRMVGAEVIFCDVDADTGLMTPETLEAAVVEARARGLRPAVAVPVHLGGQLCDLEGIDRVARSANVSLIEDACHALGVEDVGAASFSAAVCFSTHPAKAIATGEGGLVTTRDGQAAERMRRLRSHGINRDASGFEDRQHAFDGANANPWYYEMKEFGWNYRIPDVLCALGISQLKKLDGFLSRRREIAAYYDRALRPLAPAIRAVPHGNRAHGWHLYALLVDFRKLGVSRAKFMDALRGEGIGTQVHYIPLHFQPYFQRRYGTLSLPGAEEYYARCLSIPFYPSMTDDDVERVVRALSKIAAK